MARPPGDRTRDWGEFGLHLILLDKQVPTGEVARALAHKEVSREVQGKVRI